MSEYSKINRILKRFISLALKNEREKRTAKKWSFSEEVALLFNDSPFTKKKL